MQARIILICQRPGISHDVAVATLLLPVIAVPYDFWVIDLVVKRADIRWLPPRGTAANLLKRWLAIKTSRALIRS
jgi:hypothetical protein